MKFNILVVDDEPVARQSLSDILKLEGYSVVSANNGQIALGIVRSQPIDLMVIDLKMPGMDGLEVIQVLNQIAPDTEVILLTAYGSTDTAIQALRLRIHDYLLKPASAAQIIASVKKALLRRSAKINSQSAVELHPDETGEVYLLKDGTTIDLNRRQIRYKNKIEHLTPAEGRLMSVFMENAGKVFSHRELVLLVQGYDTSQREAPEILRPLVSRLRNKLDLFPLLSEKIVSIRGTGYLYEGNS